VQRLVVTPACALVFLCTPLAAVGQTPAAGTGAGSGSGNSSARAQSNVANLPVCGQSASSARSSASSRRSKAQRAKRRARDRRARGAGGKKAAASTRPEPVRATLTLDEEDQETVTAAEFGRSTDPQPLTLVYRVTGCRVTADVPLPRSPLPTGPVNTAGARPLPLGSVQIDEVDADGDRYVVYLRVFVSSNKAEEQGGSAEPSPPATATPTGDRGAGSPDGTATAPGGASRSNATETSEQPSPGSTDTPPPTSPPDEFGVDPGSYTSFVRLKADWMHTVATPVTVTRSEDSEWIAAGIGIIGGVSGFIIFSLLRKIHGQNLLITEQWVLWVTAGISIGVGAGTAYFTNYINQEVWTFEANGVALFTAAFSASTAGVAAGLLTGIYNTTQAGGIGGQAGGGGQAGRGGGQAGAGGGQAGRGGATGRT
jgi:hypothetical protein